GYGQLSNAQPRRMLHSNVRDLPNFLSIYSLDGAIFRGKTATGSTTIPRGGAVMPLPGTILFPHALLPLHIFEPRYQEMLELALSEHRMFCVALVKPPRAEWKSTGDFFHIAGVGLIRACVGSGNGTSNLILQGLRRVRFHA